jgi:hypothetical protein
MYFARPNLEGYVVQRLDASEALANPPNFQDGATRCPTMQIH